jgi:CubicO group peptidase (beta-lactamase class C family)
MMRLSKFLPGSLVCASAFLLNAADEADAIRRIEENWKPAARMAELKVPGVSVAVVRDSKLAWAKGYGVKRAGSQEAVDASTMFQAASISKPVAAMAAMHMAQFGAFALDEDVNAKLKSWKVPENAFTATEKVTMRRLLSHSAGLTVHGFRGYARDESVPTTVQVLNGAPPANSKPVVPDVVPGSLWRYSGGGYTVAQVLMTDLFSRGGSAAKTFPELMSTILLGRLGMKNSTYEQPLPQRLHSQAAHGHRNDGSVVRGGGWHIYPEMAAAGLWTTPSDLALAAIEMQKARRGESNKVIEQKTAVEMLSVQKGDYGLGWGVQGEWFQHGGSNEGFKCLLRANGRDAVIVMTNGDRGMELIRDIVKAVSAEYGWKEPAR